MKTKADEKPKLTPAQLAAVDHLAAGLSATDAAARVSVARQTVSRWLNQDAAFIAELNGRRAELWGETADRLRALLPRAVETIAAAIEAGGPDALAASIALIRLAKIDPTPTGSTDAEAIETARAERDRDIQRRKMFAM